MKALIQQFLHDIEEKHGVRILYACESGSRAWGFESFNSDYDVRFIYVRPLDWYLSVADKRDVIETPMDRNLDINGWDIRKALCLLRKSNSVLLEWLASPIKYREDHSAVESPSELGRKAFIPMLSCRHYLGMAKRSMAGYQADEKVRMKSYLYAVRPVLCCRWIVMYQRPAPMPMGDLMAEFLPDQRDGIRQYLDHMIKIKKESDEEVRVERSPLLESYLLSQLEELECLLPGGEPQVGIEEFDRFFRSIVKSGNAL